MENNYKAQIEAILFTMGESVEISKIANALEIKPGQVKKIVKEMQKELEDENHGIKIIELDNAYQMCTKPEMYESLIKIAKQPKRLRNSSVVPNNNGLPGVSIRPTSSTSIYSTSLFTAKSDFTPLILSISDLVIGCL